MSTMEHQPTTPTTSAQERVASVTRSLMAGYGETQAELAAAIGVDQTAVSKMLACTRKVTLGRVADAVDAIPSIDRPVLRSVN